MADIQCPECKGSGIVTQPDWEEWYKRNPVGAVHEPTPQHPQEIACSTCEGAGTVFGIEFRKEQPVGMRFV